MGCIQPGSRLAALVSRRLACLQSHGLMRRQSWRNLHKEEAATTTTTFAGGAFSHSNESRRDSWPKRKTKKKSDTAGCRRKQAEPKSKPSPSRRRPLGRLIARRRGPTELPSSPVTGAESDLIGGRSQRISSGQPAGRPLASQRGAAIDGLAPLRWADLLAGQNLWPAAAGRRSAPLNGSSAGDLRLARSRQARTYSVRTWAGSRAGFKSRAN